MQNANAVTVIMPALQEVTNQVKPLDLGSEDEEGRKHTNS